MNLERFKKIVTGLIAFAGAYLIANAAGAFDGTVFHLSASVVHNITAAGMAAGLFSKSLFGMSLPGIGTLPGTPTAPVNAPSPTPPSNIVKSLLLLLAFCGLAAMAVGCATTGGPDGGVAGPTTSVPVQIAQDCGTPAVRDVATHLVDDVASALLTAGDWQQALANLGAEETKRLKTDAWPAILCAVEEIGARTGLQLGARANMSPDAAEQTQTLHDRAIGWASSHRAPPAAH